MNNFKIGKLLLGAVVTTFALGATAPSASANVISLNQVFGNLYQQTEQSPCIFENPSCQQGTFVGTELDTGGAVTSYDEFSPVYTGQQILNIIGAGNALLLGLDINQASGQPAQTLTAFYMLKNGVVVDTFTGSTGNVPAGNNGNGYADYLLGNFSSFAANDTVQFHFVFNNGNDGTENVFLIGAPGTPVPEPASLLLLGTGMLGVARGVAKRRKTNA